MKAQWWTPLLAVAMVLGLLTWYGAVPPPASAADPGITDDTILIGMTAPMTGGAAVYSKVAETSEAVLLEYGKNIYGRNIKIIKYDDNCDPVKGIAAVKKLIYDDKVFMLHYGMCSNMVLATKPTLVSSGVPFIAQGASASPIYIPTTRNIFTSVWTSNVAIEKMIDFAMAIPNANKFGVIRHTDEWATAQYKPAMEYLKAKYNKPFAAEVTLERGSADATSQILRLKQESVDVVVAVLFPAETAVFLRDAHKLGLNAFIMGGTGAAVSDQYESLRSPEPLKRFFGPLAVKYPLDHPKAKFYQELVKKYYPNTKFDDWHIFNTGGPWVILDALKKAGRDLTREKFLDILETQYGSWEHEQYLGAVPLTFSKDNHVGLQGLTMSVYANGRINVVRSFQEYEKLMK
jgi:branched-chain amino acid transport system substrate-binding protein